MTATAATDGRTHLVDEIRSQARSCRVLGSPMYAELMERAAQDVLAGGVVHRVLAGHAGLPRGAALTLRLFGTVHRLALSGRAPELARWYPSCGGDQPFDAAVAWADFAAVCERERDEIARGLTQPPQTNEVGRGAALRAGLELTAQRTGLPLHLHELGASGGLNLLADLFWLGTPDGGRGPEGSPVRLHDAWRGELPPPGRLEVTRRRGCDIAPVDTTTAEASLRLQSYVWPDQVDRLARLRGALELAGQVPVELVTQGAADFLADLEPVPGAVTVVQHSVMWQYLPDAERAAARAQLDRLRTAATEAAPVALVSLEPRRRSDDSDVDYRDLGFEVTWACWPYAEARVIAYARPHGPPVQWLAGAAASGGAVSGVAPTVRA